MSKLHVGIVYGGISVEHDISLQSAISISNVINRNRFEVIMIRIDKQGMWYIDTSSKKMFWLRINSMLFNCLYFFSKRRTKGILKQSLYYLSYIQNLLSCIDVVFPIIHGQFGEDGSLQGLLQILNIPFVGSGVTGSAISIDKDITKRLLRDSGLKVAPFLTLIHNNCDQKSEISFENCVDVLGLPLFVKPSNQGSSVGVSKVVDRASFYRAVNCAFNFDHKILVESAIVGRELECAVLGNTNPQVSLCGEIISNGTFYTYQKKYLSNQEDIHIIIPAKINNKLYENISYVVLRAFRILQCSGMARVDFFLTLDDQIIINEINTLPGFTSSSMYPKLWEATGLSCESLITMLVELAIENFHKNNQLTRVFI